MSAPFTPEQITAIYADFARNAVDEYNVNQRFKPAIFLVARRVDGYAISEIPDALSHSFLSSEPDRLEFIVRAMLTEGSPARAAITPKPDAVVIITEAFEMPVPLDADGKPRAFSPEEIAEATDSADEILAISIFTEMESWAGSSPIAGTPKRATFNPAVRKVAAFVAMPLDNPTKH